MKNSLESEASHLTIALCALLHPTFLIDATSETKEPIRFEYSAQVKDLIQSEISVFGGKLINELGLQLQYSFEDIDAALNFAVNLQGKLDQINEHELSGSIYLLSIGIDGTKAINFSSEGEHKALEIASFIAESASPGEINLSEAVYQLLGDESKVFCRFSKQLTNNASNAGLNVYEAFWNPREVEINGGRIEAIGALDLDTQPARSFGIGLIIFILVIIIIVFIMTVGYRSAFQLVTQFFSR